MMQIFWENLYCCRRNVNKNNKVTELYNKIKVMKKEIL